MFNEFTYTFDITESYSIDLTLGGTSLAIDADGVLSAGYVETIDLHIDWSTEFEVTYGAEDTQVLEMIVVPIDVAAETETPLTTDDLYLTALIGWTGSKYTGLSGTTYNIAYGSETLVTTQNNDYGIIGGEGRTVKFRGGNDYAKVDEDAGGMTFKMGSGDDIAYGGSGDDQIFGGTGDDRLYGKAGNDKLVGHDGDDVILDAAGTNVLRGDAGNDVLQTWGENDRLFGGTGNDVLASQGQDTVMSGGSGADAFVFLIGGHEQAQESRFVVRDFEQGVDMLWFSPHGNDTHDAQEAFDLFTQFGRQAGDHVVVRDGDWKLIIRNADFDDFSVEDFVDGSGNGGIYQWADTVA